MEHPLRDVWGWLGIKENMPAQPLEGVSILKLKVGVGADGLAREVHIRVHENSALEIRDVLCRSGGETAEEKSLSLRMDLEVRAKFLFNGVSRPASIVIQGLTVRDEEGDGANWQGTVFDTKEIPVGEGHQRGGLREDQLRAIFEMIGRAVREGTPIGSPENPWVLSTTESRQAPGSKEASAARGSVAAQEPQRKAVPRGFAHG